jgi:succinate dehydrogenase/fumarate reductase flavoprotein subunit
VAVRAGREIAIEARRGTIVCTGGYENNLAMQRDYCGRDRVYTLGTPANTGDGVTMLQRVGADLWHMRNSTNTGGLWPAMKFPEYDAAFLRNDSIRSDSWIEIGADSRRFNDETAEYGRTHATQKAHGRWTDLAHGSTLPVHMVFDEATRRHDCLVTPFPLPPSTPDELTTWNFVVEGYRWSSDNSAEIDRGWIIRADSIRELADRIGRDPDTVEATVNEFNKACADGYDPVFNRNPARLSPLTIPPFYAVELVPAVIFTTGGGRRNADTQVLAHDGRPIPRLYEAGQLGCTFANLYQNGASLAECIVFGRIAGTKAARAGP